MILGGRGEEDWIDVISEDGARRGVGEAHLKTPSVLTLRSCRTNQMPRSLSG